MADSTRRIFVNRRNSSPNLNVAESSNSIFQISVSNSSIHGNASPSSVVIVERGGIVQTETFDSSSAEEDNGLLTIRKSHSVESDVDDHYEAEMGAADKLERGINNNSNNKTMIHPAAISIQKSIIPTTPKNLEAMDCSHFGSWAELSWYFYFISTFAILGTVLRVYMGRFFGLDCLLKEHDLSSNTSRDFLTPISSLLCITSDGRLQRGGAIFIDLPANILGWYVGYTIHK